MQGECPDGMACETKRGYSQLKHCFTNFCLLLFKKKKKKSSSALLQLKRNLFSLRGANTNMTYFYFFPLFCCWLKNQFPVEAELWLQICRAAINNVTTENSVSHKLKRRNASYLANWRVKSDLLHSSDFFFFFPFCSDFRLNDMFIERRPKTLQEYFCAFPAAVLYWALIIS